MLEGQSHVSESNIAIVGMALRVPGSRNIDEFWQNVCDGVESIRSYSTEELLAAGESAERIRHPNYVARVAELPDMEMFDADFFGLSPAEAAIMDPQHRQFLECAWEAMENGGKCSAQGSGKVGVFAGCGASDYFYLNVCSNRRLVEQVGISLLRQTGNDKDFLATRVSFAFDLRGPSLNIQAAQSTSLVAVHYAAQSLLNGDCDMALAGGVTIELPHHRGYIAPEGEALSPDGHCRTLDHDAAGTVFGSGVGVVVLRRLADALRDGDVIHAIIKSTAINNDGSSKAGYDAPSVAGQAEAIAEAQALAGISADAIGYVECNATGARPNDRIEVAALTQAFRYSTNRTGFCYIGSVKTNVGHLDTAAGVVSLIKTALVLRHGEIPPNLGFERPSQATDFDRSPFIVNTKLTPWPSGAGPRRAAVNSFGVGGTNIHAILEQAPQRYRPETATRESDEIEADPVVLVLSARQRASLERAAENLAAAIATRPEMAMADIAYTLQKGRRHFDQRMVLAVRGRQDALAALSNPKARAFSHTPVSPLSGAVFLFPGGGAQYPGMAEKLYRQEESFRAKVDEGLTYLDDEVAAEIRSLWFGPRTAAAHEAFLRPSIQLPAVLVCDIALAQLWADWGVKPVALIGHSIGENAAACLSGIMTFRDAVRLVHLQGQLFEMMEPGGMLSVPLDPVELNKLLPATLDIASVNAPELCVVSGRKEDLASFHSVLAAAGVEAKPVAAQFAAHSRLFEPMLARFDAFLRTLQLQPPAIPIISNSTASPLTTEEARDPGYWCGLPRSTVRFAEGMALLSRDPGRVYIEVGPGRILSSLSKAQGTIPPNQIINSLPHPDEVVDDATYFHGAVGRAWAVGLPVDLDKQWEKRAAKLISLPTYPFHHKPYFIEADSQAAQPGRAKQSLVAEPEMSRWGYKPIWKRSLVEEAEDDSRPTLKWLMFLDDAGLGVALAARLRAQGETVVTVSLGDAFVQRGPEDYVLCTEHGRAGYEALIAALLAAGLMPDRIVHMWLLTGAETHRPGSNFFHRNQECGFYSLVHLMQAWGGNPIPSALHLTIVTNGMQQVGSEALPYPEKATVLGPALVLPREMPRLTATAIDVSLAYTGERRPGSFGLRSKLGWASRWKTQQETSASMLLDQLWAELMAPPKNQTLALRDGVRWSRHRRRMPMPEEPDERAGLRQGGIYFISGGLGDIGFTIAMELAKRLQAKLILFGRTSLPPRADWHRYCLFHGNDAVRRAIARIEALEEAGADILYVSGNVANPEDVAAAVQAGLERFGAIHGVLHAAGIADDGLAQVKSDSSMERVMTPKVLGTTVLDAALRDIPLDLFVLFSSAATDVAGPGQVDYVAANAYLNAYAQSRAGTSARRTVALHWGIWKEIGFAARRLDEAATPDGPRETPGATQGPISSRLIEDAEPRDAIAPSDLSKDPGMLRLAEQVRNGIPPEQGFELLLRALATHEPQPIISSIDLDVLEEWLKGSKEVVEATPVRSDPSDFGSDYLAPRNSLEERLAQIWQELLGVARVGVNDSFFDLGGHSLIAVKMFRLIKNEFGLDLPISFLLEHPTIALCAGKILTLQPEGLVCDMGPVAPSASQSRQPLHLVLMDAGQVKDATPLFVCAGMFGNILNLRHFAREVGIDRPVYGLQARGLYGDHEPHTSFADMARDYLAEIREIQPEGPYLLAGYSGGGITAFEIAQQLLAQGEQVGHVVMLDTAFPQQPPLILRDRMLMKAQDLWRYKHAFLSEWLREKKRWKAEISAKRRALEQPDRAPDGFNNYAIEAAYRQAAQTYQARPFPGKITLLRATPTAHYRITQGRLLQKNRNIILNDNGWRDYVAELLILQVPGDHDSMMLDPYVKVVGRYARSALLEAEKNWRDIALPGAANPQEPKLAATRQAETA